MLRKLVVLPAHSPLFGVGNYRYGIQYISGMPNAVKYQLPDFDTVESYNIKCEEELGTCFFASENIFLFKNMFGHILKFDQRFNLLSIRVGLQLSLISYTRNPSILAKESINGNFYIGWLDNENLELISKINFDAGILGYGYNDKIFTNDRSQPITLVALVIEQGKILWQVNLSQYLFNLGNEPQPAQIKSILGHWQNYLLVWMEGNQLLSLDIQTGQITWQMPNFLEHFPNEWTSDWWYWHLQDGKLFLLKHQQYFSVDIVTQQVLLLWQSPDKSYSITHCTYTPDYVYFTACHLAQIQPSILGAFNRKTLQVEWLEQTDIVQRAPYHSFNQPPQTDGDRVYFLDSTGTLHLYKQADVN